jgi:peptidoglycan/xylan/chitin deacetylase (PgdA/CDA1 family)/uncharacterized membrane protein YphA (DoxX/SURF4 family)
MNPSWSQITAIVVLRVLIGWHFLYEGLSKLTTPGWSASGYLSQSRGPLAGLFKGMAADPSVLANVNLLNKWGLTAIGLGLILGCFTRAAAASGLVVILMFYLCNPPFVGYYYSIPAEGSYLVVNKNLVEAAALVVILVTGSGRAAGLDRIIHGLLRRRHRPATLLVAFACAATVASAEAPKSFAWPTGAKGAVVLTYDDGMDTHLDHAAPDLDAAGLKGTFFVTGQSESLAKRMPEWRALAARGHELANHAIFHPCLRKPAGGAERDWVKPEYALEGYTVGRIRDEVAAMNTTLLALDGETVRTFAYNCCDTTVAAGQSYVDALRPLFLAARAGDDRIAGDAGALDPMLVPSWAATDVTGAQLIAFAQKAVDAGGLAVFQFHGIGGQWLSVSREAHRELIAWLALHRQMAWTDTFKRVLQHVTAEQSAKGASSGPARP